VREVCVLELSVSAALIRCMNQSLELGVPTEEQIPVFSANYRLVFGSSFSGLWVWNSPASHPERLPRCRGHLRGNGKDFNGFAEICSGSEKGSYFRLIDFCITQL